MASLAWATAWGLTDAVLDVMLGLEPTAPQRPITVPVGLVLQSTGSDEAIAEYRRLQATAPNEYDFDEARFNDATWGAIEVHRPQAAMPLLEMWTALFPKSSEAFEALGWAYLVSGESAAAARSLRTALKLNPESEMIPNVVLQGIDDGQI